MKKVALLIALCFCLSSCGGSYDAAYDCDQTNACNTETGAPALDVSTCVTNSEKLYDSLTGEQQSLLDEAADTCSSKTSCAYAACVKTAFGG